MSLRSTTGVTWSELLGIVKMPLTSGVLTGVASDVASLVASGLNAGVGLGVTHGAAVSSAASARLSGLMLCAPARLIHSRADEKTHDKMPHLDG